MNLGGHCDDVEWGGTGTFKTSYGTVKLGIALYDSDSSSEGVSRATLTLNARVDSSSHWQGLDNWLRDSNGD
jgi:hypothetical protein